LLPKGAKLLGRYHDQIGVGQNRLLLAWTRVLFPDGRSITLPGLPTTDPAGAGGVADQVDRHGRRAFGTAALLSLIGAGAQLSQPRGGYGPWGTPSAGEVAAGAVGQQLAMVATQLLQRDLDVQPTIRIRQGMPFNVFLTADLTFPGAYEPAR
jgi:type IV secretion system protein VirB10